MPPAAKPIHIAGPFSLYRGEQRFLSRERVELLRKIAETGSITQAAKAANMSYKTAWDTINALNNLAEEPLVVSTPGGRHGGGSHLTEYARQQLELYSAVEAEYQRFLHKLSEHIDDLDGFFHFMRGLLMQTSARNQFSGKVTGIKAGPINAEVAVDIGGGDLITALITTESANHLGLREGADVYALVKAASIIVIPGMQTVKLSACNQLRGTIILCKQGSVNSEIVIQLSGGKTVTAVITYESGKDLDLKEGEPATAVFKATSVILGVGL